MILLGVDVYKFLDQNEVLYDLLSRMILQVVGVDMSSKEATLPTSHFVRLPRCYMI
jgi:hypothetical protein